MAIVLKSGQSATAAAGRWRYLTEFGPARSQEVAAYTAAMIADGLAMTQPEFDALDEFVWTLIAASIWPKVTEVYPLWGGTYAGVRTKLKATLAPGLLASQNGDAIGNYELSGGRYLGRDAIAWGATTLPRPCLNSGLTVSDLGDQWGFAAYYDPSTEPSGSNVSVSLMGASLIAGSSRQTEARITFDAGFTGATMRMAHQTNIAGAYDASNATTAGGLLHYTADASGGTPFDFVTYENGVEQIALTNTNYTASLDLSRDVWLFNKNPYPGDVTNWNMNGKCRFASFDDGTMTPAEIGIYSDAVAALMAGLGKSF